MAENRKFTWLLDDQFDGYGRKLEKGKSYDAATFGEAVVEEWIRTGAARAVAAGKVRDKEE